MKKPVAKLLLCASIAVALGMSASLSANPPAEHPAEKDQSWRVGAAVDLNSLPTGPLRDKLDKLPAKARANAKKWLEGISFHERDLPYMRTDQDGSIYFADTDLPEAVTAEGATASDPGTSSVITAADAFSLHSRPGSSRVIYLDFTGHTITGTAWNSTYSTLHAVPYDQDGNSSSFSGGELDNIAEIWRRIAEDYAPFDVDVTTEEPASFGPTVGRVLITSDVDANGLAMPSQGAGGVAYVGVWGRSDYASKYSPALVYFNRLGGGRPDYVTEAASHEMGHNLGLSHDATSTSSYYGGHGSGYISWGPIMGTGYGRNVSQWSKGEYPDANQTQDDIAIIASKVSNRSDDHGNTRQTATPLVVAADGSVVSVTPEMSPNEQGKVNRGIIGDRNDVDVFSFMITGGTVTLQATPARESRYTRGGNLDVLLSLYDSSGNLLASSNPGDDTDAGISLTLAGGTYYLSVQGIGSINYSDYGSLGQYFIEGLLPVSSDDTPPTPNPMGWDVLPQATGRGSISMTAVTATDDNTAVQYLFACVAGGQGCVDSGWGSSPQYTANGLDADSTYTFQVRARDAYGNETASSVQASATTFPNMAPQATDDSGSVSNNSSLTLSVLANDNDPEGDSLSITAAGPAGNGSVSFTSSKLVYTPDSGFVGTDSFTYTATDSYGASATATVTVEVTAAPAVNLAPVLTADVASVVKGQTVVIPVLANDLDPEGDTLTIESVGRTRRGTASHDGSQITYVAGGRTGTDTFTYTVNDGHGNTASTTVTVTITNGTTSGGGGGKKNR